jgi:hypothetical protein
MMTSSDCHRIVIQHLSSASSPPFEIHNHNKKSPLPISVLSNIPITGITSKHNLSSHPQIQPVNQLGLTRAAPRIASTPVVISAPQHAGVNRGQSFAFQRLVSVAHRVATAFSFFVAYRQTGYRMPLCRCLILYNVGRGEDHVIQNGLTHCI